MSFEVLLIGILVLIFLAQWLDGLDRDRRKAREARAKSVGDQLEVLTWQKSLDDLLGKFATDPLNPSLHGDLLKSLALQGDAKPLAKGYNTILSVLAKTPNETLLKQLALSAGRIYYGKLRGGASNSDDEQKIMNDILVRQ